MLDKYYFAMVRRPVVDTGATVAARCQQRGIDGRPRRRALAEVSRSPSLRRRSAK